MRALAWVAMVVVAGCVVDVPCKSGKSRCGGFCVDESSDVKNCGACYLACADGDECVAGRCQVTPTCADGVKNGLESGVDCGGGVCPACAAGRGCRQPGDCLSALCRADHICAASFCDDGVTDGSESDVDCGGTCPNKCAAGAHCIGPGDCVGGGCLPPGVCGTEQLTLSRDHSILVAGTSQVSTLIAGLVGDSSPIAGATVSFTASGPGVFVGGDGGTFTANTDSSGNAIAQMTPADVGGDVTVTARALSRSAVTTISVTTVQQLEWVSTNCGGNSCNTMGTKGSGFNENASVTFRVRDSVGLPAAGVSVTFSSFAVPTGVTITPSGVTDANGLATTFLQSGSATGSFLVHAATGGISVDSPAINVIGAKPTNNGIIIQCAQVNLAAYDSASPPLALTISCTVTLRDRYSSPIQTGVAVNLQSEAGLVPSAVVLSTTTGAGTFTFSTNGGPLPLDVAPLAADSNQSYPGPRAPEPSYNTGGLTLNPRDGLVTLLAYVQGEEFFSDNNVDGVHQANETFIDQGEPFVDSNDDGVWSTGELYIDSNANGVWDGPNGVWDSHTTVWADTTLLYTDQASASHSSFSPATYGSCPDGGVPKGGFVDLQVFVPDERLNIIEGGSALSAFHTATSGSVSFNTGSVLDSYGFDNQRLLVNPSGNICTFAVDPLCTARRFFQSWGGGYVGLVRITGAPPMDTNPCVSDSLVVTTNTRAALVQVLTTGAIQ